MSEAAIIGIGTWLPDHIRTNDWWPPEFSERHKQGDRTFNDIPESDDPISAAILARDLAKEAEDPFLGAKLRHIADLSMTSIESESLAAIEALRNANVDPEDVDLILSYAILPERVVNPTAPGVGYRIGANKALAIGTDAACASSVVGLEIAKAYIDSGMAEVVLLTQSHLLVKAFPEGHPALPGLGDGASAIVVGQGLAGDFQIRSCYSVTHGEYLNAVTYIRGQDDASDIPWYLSGGNYRLGSRNPEQAKTLMRETVSYGAKTVLGALNKSGYSKGSIEVLLSVQPRGFIPGAIAERLGLPRETAVTTYEEIAHLGACGLVFNLKKAIETNRLTRGSAFAMYGQGAGFTRSAAILEVL